MKIKTSNISIVLIAFLFFSSFFWKGACVFSQNTRLWATYYGGTGWDNANSVACDASGNVYIAGTTNSSNIASAGFQNVYGGGSYDAFLVKFDASGNRLWATYYGGTGADYGHSVACDALGNVYLAGYTDRRAHV